LLSTGEFVSLTEGNANVPRPSPLRHNPLKPNRMGLANSADRCNFATEGVNGQAEQWGHTAVHAEVLRPSQSSPPCSRFASCRLSTVPVFLASYGSSDRAWPTLCKRPGRLRPTCASSVRSTSAPSDTATMPSNSTVTRTAGDARAVPRARSPRFHGAYLLAQEPRSSSLTRRLADGARARQVHSFRTGR
jgi:hypothetical protein